MWFASCWDEQSVDFIDEFNPPCYKIASASITDRGLLNHTAAKGKPLIISTGMSTMEEIREAIMIVEKHIGNQYVILHCTSTYPCPLGEINLNVIRALRNKYNIPIGYSGHETGLVPTMAAVAIGACIIERHITLDRGMYGSDQAASLEEAGLKRMIRDVRAVEKMKKKKEEETK